MFHVVLFQPEIAANVGAMIRTAACFSAELHVIEPCGFPWRDREIRRVALDYACPLHRHVTADALWDALPGRKLLLTTKASEDYAGFTYRRGDALILGQESAGAPEAIHQRVDARLRIPLSPDARSLNVATAGAIVLSEVSRQLRLFR